MDNNIDNNISTDDLGNIVTYVGNDPTNSEVGAILKNLGIESSGDPAKDIQIATQYLNLKNTLYSISLEEKKIELEKAKVQNEQNYQAKRLEAQNENLKLEQKRFEDSQARFKYRQNRYKDEQTKQIIGIIIFSVVVLLGILLR